MRVLECSQKKFQKSFKKFQKVSKSFKKFQKSFKFFQKKIKKIFFVIINHNKIVKIQEGKFSEKSHPKVTIFVPQSHHLVTI